MRGRARRALTWRVGAAIARQEVPPQTPCGQSERGVCGGVASDPTVSRRIDTSAASGGKALQALHRARAEVRSRARSLAGTDAPDQSGEVTVDLDGVLVLVLAHFRQAGRDGDLEYSVEMTIIALDEHDGDTGVDDVRV
ncbi:hypothetical protein SBRY_90136 [Actinacidiphila bryophytorum]|uniref:Uncharacterized protein n=1 Tax=Actinacidiphila bryophytorum TaxID=1436133 RepID=A0A9W4H7M4_9ACTN|nr:hypothetical protein SBRY_90136 [Actinacidiphila bryophytorum]